VEVEALSTGEKRGEMSDNITSKWGDARRALETQLAELRTKITEQESILTRLHEQETEKISELRLFDEAVNTINSLPPHVIALIETRGKIKSPKSKLKPPLPATVTVTPPPAVRGESREQKKWMPQEEVMEEVYGLLHYTSPATVKTLREVTGKGEFGVGQALRQLRAEGRARSEKQPGGGTLQYWYKARKEGRDGD
jgi:hypothetical protein